MNFLKKFNILIVIFHNLFALGGSYSSWLILGNVALSVPFGRHMCDQIQLVPQQKRQCERHPQAMASVRDGAHLSILECQHQFRNNRWNCSAASKGTGALEKDVHKEKPHLILTVYRSGSREAAFVHAITSAGVTYKVTQACSRGDLEDCSCDKRKRGASGNASFIWGGCSDDVKYGMKFAERFIDASETDRFDARSTMNRHNNKVGRKAVKINLKHRCKCHGPTTSCTTWTCWDELGDFRETGDYLKSQFNKATQVTLKQDGTLMRKTNSRNSKPKPPNKERLVYLEESPNYCEKNLEIGSLGTSGRECNKTSKGEDGCDHVCCGRGYDTKRVRRVETCHCKFHWCCKVICHNCTRELDVHTCKPEVTNSDQSTDFDEIFQQSKKKRRRNKGKGLKKARGRRRRKKKIQSDPARSKRDAEISQIFGQKSNRFYYDDNIHLRTITVEELNDKSFVQNNKQTKGLRFSKNRVTALTFTDVIRSCWNLIRRFIA